MRYAKRFLTTLLLMLLLVPVCTGSLLAEGTYVRFLVGAPGQTDLYARIRTPGGTYVAIAISDEGSAESGIYTADNTAIAALTGMNVASTGDGCWVTVRAGATPSNSNDDPIVGHRYLKWSGTAEVAASTGSGTADTRDLEPVQFTWTLSSRSDGTMESTNKLVIGPGETLRCGFKCDGTKALPTAGTVLRTMATPTVTNAACTATKLGIDPSVAKIEVAADPGATAGTSGYVRTTITNNHGAGPVTLLGKFVIAKEPQ